MLRQILFMRFTAVFLPLLFFVAGSSGVHAVEEKTGPPGPSEAGAGAGLGDADRHGILQAYQTARHQVRAIASGHEAENPGQQWVTRFDGHGFTTVPDAAGWQWGLELDGYGFNGELKEVAANPGVRTAGNRLEYGWTAGLTEWYINDQRGLEHGFTVMEPPTGKRDSPAEPPAGAAGQLEFHFKVRGGLVTEIAGDRLGVGFRKPGGDAVLTYSGLKAWDADQKSLTSQFVPDGNDLTLKVDVSGARFPITIDPIAQQAYLKASNTGAGDLFGGAVAISGETVVIGAIGEASNARGVDRLQSNNTAGDSGAVYVFARDGISWAQQAYLKASNGEVGDQFGSAVAISGNTLVVGAQSEDSGATTVNGSQTDNNAPLRGAAYVFVRNESTWTQQAYLKPGYASSKSFGAAVSVTGDTVVVGSPSDSSNSRGIDNPPTGIQAGNSGAAYVFARSGTTWTQQAYLKASNTAQMQLFGTSVSADGETIVVGAPREASAATGVNGDQADNSAAQAGAAYIFFRSGSTWVQQAYLKASNTRFFDSFGTCVGISGDRVVVGSPRESGNSRGVNGNQAGMAVRDRGAAYVFSRNGSTWMQEAYVKASNDSRLFGTSAAISGDTMVIGSPDEDTNSTGINGIQSDENLKPTGAAYTFVRTEAGWSQVAYLKAGNTGFSDEFGQSVAVSGDVVVVGARMEDSNAVGFNNSGANDNATDSGAAYVFTGFSDRAPEIRVEATAEIADGGTFDFGTASKNTSGAPISFTVRNTGSADLTGLAVAKDGSHPGDFIVSSPEKETLGPGESLTLSITFHPTEEGTRSCDLHLASNDEDESPYDIRLTGFGEQVKALPLGAALRLKGYPVGAGDFFGSSIAISGDIMVVGGVKSSGSSDSGGVYIFVRNGGGWEQEARLKPTDFLVSRSFGQAVSISGDTVVVGSPGEGLLGTDAEGNPIEISDPLRSGAVYVFTRKAKKWILQSRLNAEEGDMALSFGKAVSISGDTLVAGVDTTVGTEFNAGAVHVLQRSGTSWTRQTILTASIPVTNSQFGYSVAMDRDSIVVGSPNVDSQGAVYIYSRSGGNWGQQALLNTDGIPYVQRFGFSVGISGDTVIVGAPEQGIPTVGPTGNPGAISNAGAGYIFLRTGFSWALQSRHFAPNADAEDHFGHSVAIDGDVAVIGALQESSNAAGINGDPGNNLLSRAGAAYAFTRFGTTWTQQAYLKANIPHADDRFGQSVGVSGGTVVVGSPSEDSRGYDVNGHDASERATDSGMVHVFEAPVDKPSPEINILSGENLTDGDTVDLGRVAVGAASRPRPFTLTNSGKIDLNGLSYAITGGNPEDFTLTPPEVNSVGPSGSLAFQVTFTPGDSGPREALLQCFSNDGDESPFNIRLTGTGTSAVPLTRAQTAYLKASNAGADNRFGAAVAVFGNTVVVGAPYEGGSATGVNGDELEQGAPYSGAAYVFTNQNGAWTQQAYLKSGHTRERDNFGSSVAISGDTVVVGAPHESNQTTYSGAAYVFVRKDGVWSLQTSLTADNPGFFHRFSAALAIDGDTLAVGAPEEGSGPLGTPTTEPDPAYANSGAVYIFTRTDGVWKQEAMLKSTNASTHHRMGSSVAVSGDTVLAGATYENQGKGAAYVFVRTGGHWTQQVRLSADTVDNSTFGWALSLDGDVAAIGAPEEAVRQGAVYVFGRSAGLWTLHSRLVPRNPSDFQYFGLAVAVSGQSILVGSQAEDSIATGLDGPTDEGAPESGAAWLFTQVEGNWVQQSFLKAGNTGEGDHFGAVVAMHGNTIVCGAPLEDSGSGLNGNGADNSATDSGAAYIFSVLVPPGILLTGNNLAIANAAGTPDPGNHTDFEGTAYTGGTVRRSFSLTNNGMVNLIPGNIVLDGPQAADFQVISPSPAVVRPGESVLLEIQFDPAAIGLRQAVVSFTSNAVGATPFSFAIQGNGLNTPPVALAQQVRLLEDSPVNLTLTAQDLDAQNLTLRIFQAPAHGKLSGAGPDLIYSPDLNFFGPDSFSFVANDGIGDSLPGVVALDISPVNDSPVVARQLVDIVQIRPGLMSELDLTANFSDVETAASTLEYKLNPLGPDVFYRSALDSGLLSLEGLGAGSGEITVRATDSEGLFVDSTFRFTVKHVPELTSLIPDQRVIIGQPLTLQAAAFFIDRDADALSFSATAGSATPASSSEFSGSSLLLTGLSVGVTEITVQVTDADGNSLTDTFAAFSGTEYPTVVAGTPVLERQTGLHVQTLQVTNTTGLTSEGFRLHVTGLPAGVTLYNSMAPPASSGSWIDYRNPSAPGAVIILTLTYHVPDRMGGFTPLLTMAPLPVAEAPAAGLPPVAVERFLRLGDGSMLIEFSSISGRFYQVQYSDDLIDWKTSPASLRAGANRVQWIDRGPPDTVLLPGLSKVRYYRVRDITPSAR